MRECLEKVDQGPEEVATGELDIWDPCPVRMMPSISNIKKEEQVETNISIHFSRSLDIKALVFKSFVIFTKIKNMFI